MLGRCALLLLTLLWTPAAVAQVQDDFADGDFTAAPPWQGDTDRFAVVPFGDDFALGSDGLAEPDTIALATASDVATGRWTFTFGWSANLTIANGTRVYLVADTTDLKGAVRGYYVQLGTNNSDEVRLYRQDGPPDDRAVVGASLTPVVVDDEGAVFVEVLRDDAGGWRVSVDGTPVIEGVRDDTYATSAALGVWLKHSSANGAAFLWDDVLADPDFDADLSPPVPQRVTVLDNGGTLRIQFDEPLDASTVTPPAFSVDGGVGSPIAAVLTADGTVAELTFAPPLPTGDYTLTVSGVADPSGNAIDEASVDFSFTADTTPPALVSAMATSATRVNVTFDEPVEGCDVTRYEIAPDVGPPDGIDCPGGGTDYGLLLDTPLTGPQTYTVTARDILDLNGNAQPQTSASFFFGIFDLPAPRDIVVNEVMYDPPDTASDEYVELFNRTADRTFDLSMLALSDASGEPVAITDQPTALSPGEYAVLVRDAESFALQFPEVDFIEVEDFPALNNGGDAVVVRHVPSGTRVDSVRYLPEWGGSDASLERRSPNGPSDTPSNWTTSTDPRGGTPGAPNSAPPDTAPPTLVDVDVAADGLTLTVFFDEPLDDATVVPSAFSIDNGAPAVTETAYLGDDLPAVRLTLAAPLDGGDYTLTVTGVADQLGNATLQATIAFSFAPDETPPTLLRAAALDATTVDVLFSEPVDDTSAGDPSSYSIDGGIGTPLSAEFAPAGDPDRVRLTLATPLAEGTRYLLTVARVADLVGNVLEEATAPFFFGEGAEPVERDIVVNEIQFQSPDGSEGEYVELFNRSDAPFDLSQFTLSDAGGAPAPLADAPFFLLPEQYAVLVADAATFAASFPDAGPVLEVGGFPNLNSGGDAVVLRYSDTGTTVDSVTYEPDWGDSDAAALERIDPDAPGNVFVNWASSTAEGGGTPGAANSVFAPDTGAPAVVFAEQLGATVVRVYFTEPLDPATVEPTDFALSSGATPDSVSVSDAEALVDLAFDTVDGGTVEVGAVADFVGNAGGGTTAALARLAPVGGLVVNEIMFDPLRDPNDGRLDGTEYVELYNATDWTLTLTRLRITDAPDENGAVRDVEIGGRLTGTAPFAALEPGGYAVAFADTSAFGGRFPLPPTQSALADSSLLAQFYTGTDFSEALLLPVDRTTLSLTNTEDTIRLLRGDGVLVDSVAYSDGWHRPELDDATGVALERIGPDGASSDASTWTSSLDPSGGTPGRPNSVFLLPGEAPPEPGLTIAPSPFNADVGTQISYTLEADAALVRARIFDGAGRLVRTLEDAALGGNARTGALTWQGRNDDGRPLRIGIYVVFLEALDLNGGRTEAYKGVVVLARNL